MTGDSNDQCIIFASRYVELAVTGYIYNWCRACLTGYYMK